ncbi:MAG TPA: hypothetical protein P5294_02055 [Smithellaceae bacterium]|nr:hypothetical protein [Smithellaceae bacterium]HRS88542.1 hypothetical protein [Smithellaceae bacterium]HRV25296.1 hypothetical protein [Smithellaceae bacterium]
MNKILTKILLTLITIPFITSFAFAEETCAAKAAAEKLVGKAEARFIQKCEAETADADTGQEANAKKKNIDGIAKGALLKILLGSHKYSK